MTATHCPAGPASGLGDVRTSIVPDRFPTSFRNGMVARRSPLSTAMSFGAANILMIDASGRPIGSGTSTPRGTATILPLGVCACAS